MMRSVGRALLDEGSGGSPTLLSGTSKAFELDIPHLELDRAVTLQAASDMVSDEEGDRSLHDIRMSFKDKAAHLSLMSCKFRLVRHIFYKELKRSKLKKWDGVIPQIVRDFLSLRENIALIFAKASKSATSTGIFAY